MSSSIWWSKIWRSTKTKGERKWQKQLQTQHLKQKQKRRFGLGRLLGNLGGPCRMQAPILEKLSEELSEDELKS